MERAAGRHLRSYAPFVIGIGVTALPAKDAPIIQQETVETSTGAETLAAADDGIVDTDDAAEQGFSDKYRPRNTKLPAPPKREPTKQPAYLKSVAQPVVPTNNPAAPFGYDDNDRPIGVPVGKPYVKPVQTGTIERSERGPLCKKFADCFDAQNLIVKEGEDGFLNFAQLLRELRGREVTTDTLFQAMGRISYRPGRQLAYVQKERKQVDPSYKPGQFLSDYNVSPDEHQRRLRASRTQEQDSQAARHSRDQAVAKHEAEKLRSGYSHAEDAQVSKLFVTDPQTREIDWVATKNARSAMLQRFANRRARLEVIS